MQYFYDGQIRRYLTQFIRALSGFKFKESDGTLREIPVRFATADKQVANILRQNSENFLMQAPFITVYISNLELSRARLQDPNFVSKVNVREREYDEVNNVYTTSKGSDVTVERLMPNPFQLTMTADIWTTSIDQKLQVLEQIVVLFNPAIELQTTSSYLDWTSLTTLELMDIQYTNQTVPNGDQDFEIASLTFMAPIWLSPPSKVKRMGVITDIIARVFDDEGNISLDDLAISKQTITVKGYSLLITNEGTAQSPNYVAKLLASANSVVNEFDSKILKLDDAINWRQLLERYPGPYLPGVSKIILSRPDGRMSSATMTINEEDETIMNLNFSGGLVSNTLIDNSGNLYYSSTNYDDGFDQTTARGTIDAIIDPNKPLNIEIIEDVRLLILEDIRTDDRNYGPDDNSLIGVEQWKDFEANANDIIRWNSVNQSWQVIFDSRSVNDSTYITNEYTKVQYKWDGIKWTKSMEGVFKEGEWQIIL
jgi:hypothetical protein